ncbi:MAG: YjjG family noncanonical pyrimidine nucleotidase [Spirosomataceae bacterium]
MPYKHLFFDLDHTLWDYERNAAESLSEMYLDYQLAGLGIGSAEAFVESFRKVNEEVWYLYDNDIITQQELRHRRFRQVFDSFGVSDHSLCDELNAEYLRRSPQKPHLIEFAKEILDYLQPNYIMHLITNGFDEIQGTKLRSSGITHYFVEVITSQRAQAKKPSPAIFDYAVSLVGVPKAECLMIGDNWETDIKGAIAAQMDVVHYNPDHKSIPAEPTHTIRHLRELMEIL